MESFPNLINRAALRKTCQASDGLSTLQETQYVQFCRPDSRLGWNSGMPNILIVDDSPDVRSIVQIFLERDATFTVCGEAGSGLEAIKKAQELKPDLVLLDLRMPGGMNGIETAMALRS